MRMIALDPGARWTGYVELRIKGRRAWVRCGVIDGKDDLYASITWLDEALGRGPTGHVVAENFRLRPSLGHQAWTEAGTARLLGAAEWVTRKRGWSWSVERPGPPEPDLSRLRLSDLVARYRRRWPRRGDAEWNHALSAWRVLGLALARTDAPLALALGRARLVSIAPLAWEDGLEAPRATLVTR